jgi:hypothetical protein
LVPYAKAYYFRAQTKNCLRFLCFVYRIGKGGTLTLEGDPNKAVLGSVQGKSEGLSTVLEMNPLTTRFYVGGLPDGAIVSNRILYHNSLPVIFHVNK